MRVQKKFIEDDPFPVSNLFDQDISNKVIYLIDSKLNYKISRFRRKYYPNVSINEWNDWRWQVLNLITSIDDIQKILKLSEDEINGILLNNENGIMSLSITPYYASLIDPDNYKHPIRRAVIPTSSEFIKSSCESIDPLDEEHMSPVKGIVHRYPDRVLFLATGFCPVNCRYCTRSRIVKKAFNYFEYWDAAIAYIKENKNIRDVLISGGEPLTLSDEMLDLLLSKIKSIRHVEVIRIGTKAPVTMPQRITKNLVKILKKYHPLWMSIHFMHASEITPELKKAVSRLADAGIPLGSQTVLLKGINDTVLQMKDLFSGLMSIRVKPYYLYQCDPIIGSSHFRTPVSKGLEIIKGIRGYCSGYMVPQYIIDAPHGGGKVPLLPDYLVSIDDEKVVLKNYEDKIFEYIQK